MIKQETIDRVLDTARIDEVVGDFVVLKKRGNNLLGLCPFHNEKTPSFNVNLSKGIYKCFGCGQAGNSVKFVMDHEKLTFPEAIQYLARKYQIEIEETALSAEVKAEQQEKESLMLVNAFAEQWFESQLWESPDGQAIGLSYFRERGFTDDTIRKFKLGYHPEGWDIFAKAAREAGYNLEYLVKTGLVIEKDGKHFDRFRNRMMFPIHNVSGKAIGFGGRILTNDKKLAKYVNSPESEVYNKSQVLYGIDLARKSIVEKDQCILVEGYTDVISMHQCGISNVVSSSGTSLTEGQIQIIRRYTSHILMLYDGDAAGIKASFRGIDMILEQGLHVKIVLLPEGHDPDSFAKSHTPQYVQQFIQEEAKDFIRFKLDLLKEESAGDPIRLAEVIKDIVASIAQVPNALLRNLYIRECSHWLKVEEALLMTELNQVLRKKIKSVAEKPSEQAYPEQITSQELPETQLKTHTVSALWQENALMQFLVKYANAPMEIEVLDEQGNASKVEVKVGDYIIHELELDELPPIDPTHLKIFNYLKAHQNLYPEADSLLRHPDADIQAYATELFSERHHLSERWKEKYQIHTHGLEHKLHKRVVEAMHHFKLKRVMEMIESVQQELKNERDESKSMELLGKQTELLEIKVKLSRQLSFVIV